MNTDSAPTSLQLRSVIRANSELEVSLRDVPMPEPAADEVLVRIEATPINPSDLGLLFGAADGKPFCLLAAHAKNDVFHILPDLGVL